MINVGIIGSGFIVPRFLEACKEAGDYCVKAISSPHNYERLKELKEAYSIDDATLNYKDILKNEEIDVIYIASPNGLHYEHAKEALNSGKSVICEKPFTRSYDEAQELINLANEKGLMIYEAIMTPTLPNYQKVKKALESDEVKKVDLNFSQYSHRYDDFKKGIIKPVFDKELAGGALMDLNVYNICFVIGLFGDPLSEEYYPNIEKNIDVSGKLLLGYPQFEASLVAAKNKQGPTYVDIITNRGILHSDNPASTLDNVKYCELQYIQRGRSVYYYELEEFKRIYKEKDLKALKCHNDLTLSVVKVLEKALRSAGLY